MNDLLPGMAVAAVHNNRCVFFGVVLSVTRIANMTGWCEYVDLQVGPEELRGIPSDACLDLNSIYISAEIFHLFSQCDSFNFSLTQAALLKTPAPSPNGPDNG